MVGVAAYGAIMRESSFYGAKLDGANFSGADLKGADIQGAKGRLCIMTEARIDEGGLISCDFTQSDLSHARLTRSMVGGNDFTNADLTGIKLDKSHFFSNILDGAKVYDVEFTKIDTRFTKNKLSLDGSVGDTTTKIGSLDRPASWPNRELTWNERRVKSETEGDQHNTQQVDISS